MEDKVQKIQESDSGVYGAQIASEVHRELKKIGGVKPPKEFVFMDRAAVGLGSVFMHLSAEVNWYRVFHELIDNFDQKNLTRKQQNRQRNGSPYELRGSYSGDQELHPSGSLSDPSRGLEPKNKRVANSANIPAHSHD